MDSVAAHGLRFCVWIDDRVCGLRVISHGGGVRGATKACSRPWLLAWHSIGDGGAVRGWFLLAPLPGCGGVVFGCVCCLCGAGVRFGTLCMIASFRHSVAVLLPFILKNQYSCHFQS